MFTGIIEEVGQILSIEKKGDLAQFTIQTNNILTSSKIGDSISVNGICLTITLINDKNFMLDAVKETLDKTNLRYAKANDYVNLERAMKADSRFDGHIVQGHIEAVGKVKKIRKNDDSLIVSIELPLKVSNYCIHKGSIAVNGVSLTVASIKESLVDIWIIPHTLNHTTFNKIKKDDFVNIETDIIAKYVEKLYKVNN